MSPISRGFHRRRGPADPSRLPPGQYLTGDFPVLSAGPTPHTPLEEWSFTIRGAVPEPVSWRWEEFVALRSETVTTDIHCVTKWSKLDTSWKGVSVDTLLGAVQSEAGYVKAWSDGGYTTNLALKDVTDGQGWIAYEFGGAPLEPEHGGPARLLVPHLYFWKSAKWVRGLTLTLDDEPGSGRPTAITTTATHGSSSAIRAGGRPAADLHLRPQRVRRGDRRTAGRPRTRSEPDQNRTVRTDRLLSLGKTS